MRPGGPAGEWHQRLLRRAHADGARSNVSRYLVCLFLAMAFALLPTVRRRNVCRDRAWSCPPGTVWDTGTALILRLHACFRFAGSVWSCCPAVRIAVVSGRLH